MSREIKFRAWAQNAEVMVYQKHFFRFIDGGMMELAFEDDKIIGFYQMHENYCEAMTLDNPPLYSTDDMVKVMQYTGLKDVQGNEVYEGDIYERELHLVMYGTDLNKLCTERYVVAWNDEYGGYYFGEDPVFVVLSQKYDHHTQCRVTKPPVRIGNIYENPELLDGAELKVEVAP